MIVIPGSTDVTTYFHLRLAADGTDATGLTIANIDLQYTRSGATPAAKVDATALAAANTAHTDNYAFEIDATDQPGVYRVDWPDAAFAAGVRETILTLKCATVFTESLRAELDGPGLAAIKADTAAVLVDTNELQTDWANGGRLDLLIDAILADTAELQTDWVNGGRLDLILDIIAADTTTDIPATLATIAGYLDTEVAAILALLDTEIPALTTAVADLPTNAELATALGTADDAVLAAIAALENLSAAGVATALATFAAGQPTQSYAADTVVPTRDQFLFMILQALSEFAIVGTTITTKKLDKSTTAMTHTLDDATTPTSRTRAT